MHFLQLGSVALGMASFATAALPKHRYIRHTYGSEFVPRGQPAELLRTVLELVQSSLAKPRMFVIGDIHTTQADDPLTNTTYLDAISFTFGDINSNTSHTCTNTWKQSSSNETIYALPVGPLIWLDCQISTDNTHFQYQFHNYKDVTNFSLRFRHDFFDAAGVFHNYTSVVQHYQLVCSDVNHEDGCYAADYPNADFVPVATSSKKK